MSWDPFRELRKMQNRMERIFSDLERESLPTQKRSKPKNQKKGETTPFTDVRDLDEEVVVTADLPGVDKEDIDVSVEGNSLTISAERSQEESEESEGFVRRERTLGQFYRKIKLPSDIKEDEAAAKFNNGVLEVKLPKEEKEEKESNKIEIQ
ncbi:Hsp20/alpha crystallin family protein [archaeon SCG-AAA382B04]|nr:Hsp20/alpha crystallin family protein [archaeon SCG-AAA382B04]